MKNDILKGLTGLAAVFLIVGAIYIDDELCAPWICMIGFTWITVFYFANLERWSNVTCDKCKKKKYCIESSRDYPCILFEKERRRKWQQKKTLKTVSKNT